MSRVLPINLALEQAKRVTRDQFVVLHRAQSKRFALLKAGDRLWVREPFMLGAGDRASAPRQALTFGRPLAFATDQEPGRDGWGNARPSYTLPRAAHRQHLVVTEVSLVPLDAIPLDELKAQGFSSRADLVRSIEAALASFATLYAGNRRPDPANPVLQAIRFVRIAEPVLTKE